MTSPTSRRRCRPPVAGIAAASGGMVDAGPSGRRLADRLVAVVRRSGESAHPGVATPGVLARSTAGLFAAGGVIALIGTGPGHSPSMQVGLIRLLAWAAVASGSVVWWARRSLPRWSYHLAVLTGTVLITVATSVSGGVTSAGLYASLYLLVAVEASFFFRRPAALAHLGVALLGAQVAFEIVGIPVANRAVPVALTAAVAVAVGWLARRVDDAETDGLTGLANRRGFDHTLQEHLGAAAHDDRPLALALLDLDHFKTVNDGAGRAGGDRLLRVTAHAWRDSLIPGAVLARHSGDEFALLLPGHSPESAARTVQTLLDLLPAPQTCSVGIAARTPGDSLSLLVGRADAALYDAKRSGRDRISHGPLTPAVDPAAADLARGLEAGELFVVYQPLVDLASEETVGVEALVRWRHPTRGLVGPEEFVPTAEAGDLIHALGRFVLADAVAQGVRWRERHGLTLEIGVNAAGAELARPGYAAEVLQVLEDHGLPASQLTVEVTERTLDADSPQVLSALQILRVGGVRVSLDDFGTGYSSLSRLDRLPVDVLKVDQSFIRHLRVGADTAVLAAVVALGTALGLEVVGEGVETAEQAEILRGLGCAIAQGYHFGRPAQVFTDAAPRRADAHPAASTSSADHRIAAGTGVGEDPSWTEFGAGGRRRGNLPSRCQDSSATAATARTPGEPARRRDRAGAGQADRVAEAEAELADLECRRYTDLRGVGARARHLIRTCRGPAFSAQRGRARLILADQAGRVEDITDAVETARTVLLRARARDEFVVAARSEAVIAWCLFQIGALGDALLHAVEAVRLLPPDAPPHLLVDHRMILALFNGLQTNDDSYRDAYDGVLADAERLGNPDLLLSVLNSYAWTLWRHGQAAAALPLVARLRAESAVTGIALNSTMLDTVASVLLDVGDIAGAEAAALVMVDSSTSETEIRAAPEALLTLARIRHRRGDSTEALQLVRQAEQLAADRRLPEIVAMATMDKSRLLAETGDYEGAYQAVSLSHQTWTQVRDRDADARAASLQTLFETEQARRRSAVFEDLAERDSLTGLWNRRHLDRVLPGLLTESQVVTSPLSIAIVDIDHFKRINDERTHSTGDAVLARFGELLEGQLPEPGFTARLGGEEFLLAMPGADPARARTVCEDIRHLIQQHQWVILTGGLPVTVSIGYATSTPTATVADLLTAADRALYDAKHGGRNQVQPVTAATELPR